MITFEDKLPKYETDITISDLGEGCFFEWDKIIYQLLYWRKGESGRTYWHCMSVNTGDKRNFFGDVSVAPVNVTIIATSYCMKE